MTLRLDELILRLEAEATRRQITKKDLAALAEVHPNSLRHFRAYGSRPRGNNPPWSPTTAVLRKVEAALFPRRTNRAQPTGNTPHGDREAPRA